MTPGEFRETIKGSGMGKHESFEVKRPLADVARSFKKKAPECLNYKLTSTQTPTIGVSSSPRVYAVAREKVIQSGGRVELHFQVESVGNLAKEPPGGNYIVVADAVGLGADRTRVDIYRGGGALVAQAIRAWASGDERGCPDPMRTHEW